MTPYTFVIPSRNIENLGACVARLRNKGELSRLIVVDDGLGAMPEWFADVEVVSGEKPFCFARNCNLGIAAAAADDVILLNDDAELVTYRGFAAMADEFESLPPEYGILSPRIQGPANPVHQYTGRLEDSIDQVARMVPFVAVYIRRSVIDAVGMLDERFAGVYGGEDDDYCYRVRRAGLRIGVYNGCLVNHERLPSTFRGRGGALSTYGARQRFREIHGFEMGRR